MNDQRICPRCGKPAGEYRFCESCRAHLEALVGVPTRVAAVAGESSFAGGGTELPTSGAPTAALDATPAPPAAEERAPETSRFAVAKLPTPDVARLEDVLTIAPQPEVERAVEAVQRTVDADAVAAVIEEATRRQDIDWARLRREVARLDEVLTQTRTDAGEAPTEAPLPEVVSEPLAAEALRAAFWYEQASAFKSTIKREPTASVPPPIAVPEVERPASVPPPVAVSVSVPPPVAMPVESAPQSIARLLLDRAAEHPRVATVCLLALLGLVAALTGRDVRRFIRG